jgi:hypothetical protein
MRVGGGLRLLLPHLAGVAAERVGQVPGGMWVWVSALSGEGKRP